MTNDSDLAFVKAINYNFRKIFIIMLRLLTETLLSMGDGSISDFIKTESSFSLELSLSSSSSLSVRTIDGCECVVGSIFL
jgi:hypothetical protein